MVSERIHRPNNIDSQYPAPMCAECRAVGRISVLTPTYQRLFAERHEVVSRFACVHCQAKYELITRVDL